MPITSINGEPLAVDTGGITDGSVTDVKLYQSGGVIDGVRNLYLTSNDPISSIVIGKAINMTGGQSTNNAARARTNPVRAGGTRKAVTITDADYAYQVVGYDGASISTSDFNRRLTPTWIEAGKVTYIPSDIADVGIMFKRTDDADMEDSDASAILAGLAFYSITDPTLTLAGEAADAAAAGTRVAAIEANVPKIYDAYSGYLGINRLLFDLDWTMSEQAMYIGQKMDMNTGKANLSDPTRARTTTINVTTSGRKAFMITNGTYMMQMNAYDSASPSSATFIGRLTYGWVEAGHPVYVPDGVFAICIMYKRVDGAVIDDDEAETLRLATKAYTLTDANLSTEGKAADAAAVGNRLAQVESTLASSASAYHAADDISLVTSASRVFALYDQLLADHPDYVSRQALTSGGQTLYEYTFSIVDYNGYDASKMKRSADDVIEKPVLLITSGMHGYERSSVMSLYGFCRALCESQYVQSKMLGLRIKVIPIVCPDGYDADTRTNANGVNLNRNFAIENWSESGYGTNDYTGPSPASEDETKIVQAWLLENHDAAFYIDWHNSAYTAEVSCQLMIHPEDEDPAHPSATKRPIAKREYLLGINTITPHWRNDRGIKPTSTYTYGYTGGSSTGGFGTAIRYCYEHEIVACTVETSWNVKSSGQHSSFTIGVGTEAMVAILEKMQERTLAQPEIDES